MENRLQTEKEKERTGLEKYFIPDFNNPIDAEIMQRFQKKNHFRTYYSIVLCRSVLKRRLKISKCSKEGEIERTLQKRCESAGKTRNDYVRELFCIHFNIKIDE